MLNEFAEVGLEVRSQKLGVRVESKKLEIELEECRYYLILSKDLSYGDSNQLLTQLEEVSKLLESYSNKIQQHNRPLNSSLLTSDS